MDYTPIVLKNKGVPAEFAKTKKNDDGTWSRVFGADGEPETHILHIRVTNNTVAEMEETWGSLDGWQDAMDIQPILTLRKTLSLALRRDPYEIGESMLEGQQVTYQNCVAVAWAIANGVDPTAASLALRQSAGLAEEQRRVVEQALLQNPLSAQDSPGKSGSTSGRKRAARSKSSGN